MKTQTFKSSIAILLLILFASTKVIGIHDLLHEHHDHHADHSHHNHFGLNDYVDHDSHDHDSSDNDQEEDEECELCDKILLDSLSVYNGSDTTEPTETPIHFYQNVNTEYTSETHSTELSTALFSRPPPSLT